MASLLNDVRYALRLFLCAPGFAAVAILTLALGIGANTAIFTVVNALLIQPLPYVHADRLVMVWQDLRARGGPADEGVTPGNYADWRNERSIFDEVAVITAWRPTLLDNSGPESIPGEQVSYEYFSVLGSRSILGRGFRQSDDIPNAPRVAVIGEGLWRRRFGASAAVIGRRVTLNSEAHEIIGVMGEGFRPIVNRAAEIWRPLRLNTANPSRGAIILRAIARLPEDVTLERAQASADILARQLEAAHPRFNEKTRFNLMPLHQRVVGEIKPGLLALLGAVGFVLLIACANIANLLLARGSARSREIAVRMALGAASGRVVRQLLTESVLLAVIGGASGLLFGVWAVDALVALAPANTPRLDEIRLDPTVLTFASLLTLVTGVVFGLAPALQHSRADVTGSLTHGARGSAGGSGRTLRRGLIAAEVALALMLLSGAGLLARTFVHLRESDLGFKPDNLLTGFVNPPRAAGYDTPEKYLAFYDQIFEKVRGIPGVRSAALASVLPLSGDSDTSFMIEGRPDPASESETPVTWYRQVSASYFETMGIPMKRGRAFATREASPSVVVNETFARTYFAGQDPLGRRIRFGPDDPWFTIIGIAGDVRVSGARKELKIETYIPYWQQTGPGTTIILQAAGNPALLVAPLRQAVASVDRNVPVSGVTTLSEMVSDSIDDSRFFATLAVTFAVLAVLLSAIGIYGVMAYAVSRRTPEIGVRMALGATPFEVFSLVVGDGVRLAAIGVVAGVIGSLLMARWLTSLLFGVQATDPATLTAPAVVLLIVALAACYLPARRATRVDPMVALRAE